MGTGMWAIYGYRPGSSKGHTRKKKKKLSFLTGIFLNNYDVIDRKLKPLLADSTVGKREKWGENTLVEITKIKQ